MLGELKFTPTELVHSDFRGCLLHYTGPTVSETKIGMWSDNQESIYRDGVVSKPENPGHMHGINYI